jgi:2-polyprenyl-6-methoxyphenol hydroxylase-like FAD-dependent oxidoreductase
MLKLRRVCAGRVALIGDASGCVDAITGEGLGLAFRQAWKLAEALAASDLRAYEAAHRMLTRRPWAMANVLLTLDRRPALRERVTLAFERQPQLSARFLGAHVGSTSATSVFVAGASLGWHLLTGRAWMDSWPDSHRRGAAGKSFEAR